MRLCDLLVPLQLNPFTDEEAQCSLQLHKTRGYRTIILPARSAFWRVGAALVVDAAFGLVGKSLEQFQISNEEVIGWGEDVSAPMPKDVDRHLLEIFDHFLFLSSRTVSSTLGTQIPCGACSPLLL